jgi:exonuclease VII large subunit
MSVEVNDRKEAQRNYSETREWQSELNSLVIDLQFYQRMVDIYGLKANDAVEKRDVDLLKETLSSFMQHRVENQKNRLKMHEEYLQKVAEDRVLLKDRELPFKHKDMLEEMHDFRLAGNGLKNELFNKIEQLRSFG